jgi:plasmid stabilization system protein ParE
VKRYRVRYLSEANAALRSAAVYIMEQGGPGRAEDWLRRMLDSIGALATFPEAFPRVTVLAGRAIHSKLVNPYRVYYVIDEAGSTVYVIDVVHTARDEKATRPTHEG